MQEALQQFYAARLAEAQVAAAYAQGLWQAGTLAPPDDAQMAALVSSALLALVVNVALALLLPKGRKLVFDTVETVLAIALIIVLVGVVLGLPLGERSRCGAVGGAVPAFCIPLMPVFRRTLDRNYVSAAA